MDNLLKQKAMTTVALIGGQEFKAEFLTEGDFDLQRRRVSSPIFGVKTYPLEEHHFPFEIADFSPEESLWCHDSLSKPYLMEMSVIVLIQSDDEKLDEKWMKICYPRRVRVLPKDFSVKDFKDLLKELAESRM